MSEIVDMAEPMDTSGSQQVEDIRSQLLTVENYAPAAAYLAENEPSDDEECLQTLRSLNEEQMSQYYKKINLEIGPNSEMSPREVVKWLQRNEVLYSKVTKVEEAVYDAKLVKNLSAICRRNLEMLSTNAVTFKPTDFAKKLIQKLASNNDNTDAMSQAKLLTLGQEAKKIFSKSPCLVYLNGSLAQERMEAKSQSVRAAPRKRTKDSDLIETQSIVVQQTDNAGNKTEQRVIQILRELVRTFKENNKQPLNYFRFVLDPNSFGQSVENIFHVSFLIKEDKAAIFCEDGVPYIKPLKPKKEGQGHGNEDIDKNQVIVGMCMYEWKRLVDALKLTSALLPQSQQV